MSLDQNMEKVLARREEIESQLSQSGSLSSDELTKLSRELAEVRPVAEQVFVVRHLAQALADARQMIEEEGADPEMAEMAEVEISELGPQLTEAEHDLKLLLLPKDTDDSRNAILEVRAGTGGDEAALFAGDLFRMYTRYAENQRWKTQVMSASAGEMGGYREIVMRISGQDVYSRFKFESGAHRVQRVPATESQGRIHTSACTVAVLPDAGEVSEVAFSKDELRIDTFRSSGAGGQHVNTTDSAIRITHLPTGVVVECQDERSQHKNKAKALSMLKSRLNQAAKEAAHAEQASARKSLVGSGDRSERIRTYNYPQGRVTDHRVNVTLYKLPEVMEGDLDPLLDPLLSEYQAEQLANLGS